MGQRRTEEVVADMVTEMEDALKTLGNMSMLIPKLVRAKVDKKRERIEALIAEYNATLSPSNPKPGSKRYATLKECLRDLILDEDGDLDISGIMTAKNWPDVESPDDEESGPEPMDLENYDLLELTDTKMRMCGGGDWQEETTIELELVHGQLTVTNVEEGGDSGMDEEDFLRLLNA